MLNNGFREKAVGKMIFIRAQVRGSFEKNAI